MVIIDYMLKLLDWNNSAEKQELGIRLAGEVKCINVFFYSRANHTGKMFGVIVQKFFLKNPMKNCLYIQLT